MDPAAGFFDVYFFLQQKVLMCFQGSPIPKALPSSNVVSSLRLYPTARSRLCQSIHFLVMWLNLHFSHHTLRCKQLEVNPFSFFFNPLDMNVRMNRRLDELREELNSERVLSERVLAIKPK